ncbi:MAG TPA: serine/threonine-protein kinase [Polyangium sp.]|nr:serine/threonine-protein kinase [Polyangium sp.]
MNNESVTVREPTIDCTWSAFDDAQVCPNMETGELYPGEPIAGTPWILVRTLGRGGVGEVFEVQHEMLARKAAFKVLHSEHLLRKGLADRMLHEGRLLGCFRHPNIVEALDMGILTDGRPYLVLELLEGHDLRAEVERLGPFSIPAALRVALDVLRGLSALHDANIVHRDIKLENLFSCADGHIEILDLGAAACLDDASTERAPSLGTPRTMAPEQYEGKLVDERADLYALGVVLYELLTGRGPFDDVSGVAALRFAHCHRRPLAPSRVAPQYIPPEIDALILRALAKSPDDRFVSAAAMAAEVMALQTRATPMVNRSVEGRSLEMGTTYPDVGGWPPLETPSKWSALHAALRRTLCSPLALTAIALLALLIATLALGVAVGQNLRRAEVAVGRGV